MKRFYFVIALAFAAAAMWAQPKADGALQSAKSNTSAPRAYSAAAPGVAKAALPTASDIISTQPQGTVYKNMYRECSGFNDGYLKNYDGLASDIVVSRDGKKLYIGTPMGIKATGWLEGEIGDDGVVTFSFPQAVYQQQANATTGVEEKTYYAWNMVVDSENYKVNLADEQTVKFTWDGTSLKQVTPSETIAMADADGKFGGYGTYANEFRVMTEKPVTPPAGVEQRTYRMTYTDYFTKEEATKDVLVAIDDNDIYLGHFYNDYWIKGTINGSKVSFPAEQYLGSENITYANHEYMLVFEISDDNQNSWTLKSIDFDYDAAAGTLTSDKILGINQGKKYTALLEVWMNPTLADANYVVEAPAAPEFVQVYAYGKGPDGLGYIAYALSDVSVNEGNLDTKNIYYNIYLDGKLMTFDTDTYKYIGSPLTDVPYGYYDVYVQQSTGAIGWDMAIYQGVQFIYLYKEFSTVGVQAVYVDPESKQRFYSPLATYDVASGNTTIGISSTKMDNGAEKQVSYFDLSGRRVSAPQKGIFMKKVTYENGQTKTVKVMK